MENNEAIKTIIANYRELIEQDLKDEQNMANPDPVIIKDYELALTKFDNINESKLSDCIYEFLNVSVGL